MDIINKLLDLQKQATLERTHYYVANCVTEAIQEIVTLREQLKRQQQDSAVLIRCPHCDEDVEDKLMHCEGCGHNFYR